jgi:multidrug efflux pump subunit AcrA (membrane-fusion protein)
MYAVMNVDETDIGKIKVRQEVDVSVDAFPDELYGGTVTKIAPRTVTDQNVATIPVTVMVRANNRRLKPGMGVNCEFVIEKKRDVLMVPSEAIKNGSDGSTVTVLENNVQKVVKVTTGMVGNDTTEVTEDEAGLKEGQQVITAIIDPKKKAATGTNNNRPPGGMPGGMPGGGMPPMGGR